MPLFNTFPYSLFIFLLKQYALFYFVLFINRIAYLFLTFPSSIPFEFSLVAKGFVYGFVFDNCIISYALLGIIALCIFSYVFYSVFPKIVEYLTLFACAMLFFFISLSSVVGTLYFKEFGFFPTITIVDYLDFSSLIPILKTSLMSETLGFVLGILSIFTFLGLYVLYTRKEIVRFYSHFSYKPLQIGRFALSILLCVALGILGARGSLGHAQLEIGRSVYSQYGYLNNFAANTQFTFMLSVYNWNKERKRGAIAYSLEDNEIQESIRYLVDTNEEHIFLSDTNPLLRLTNTKQKEEKYNVVLVLMESFMSAYIGEQGAEIDLSPAFNSLINEGILFDNFYATGLRTNRGVPSTLVSYPAPRVVSITEEIVTSQKSFYSLAHILKERGYSTSFMYGGDANFDNMQGFLSVNGIDTIIDIKNIDKKGKSINWGVPDEVLFDNALEYYSSLEEPFFSTLLTLSNHSPYDVDTSKAIFKNNEHGDRTEKYNAFYYADWALGQFIEKAKKESWAKNTIFVFVADHGFYIPSDKSFNLDSFRVPLLFWSPSGLISQEKYSTIASQIDVLPTLMHFLGGTYTHSSYGKNLLSLNKDNAIAYIVANSSTALVHKEAILVHSSDNSSLYDIDSFEVLEDSFLKESLLRFRNTYLELGDKQIKNASYRD